MWTEDTERKSKELSNIIQVVAKRNQSFGKLLFLLSYLPTFNYLIQEYEPRRGRKTVVPIQMVRDILGVSQRTAQDYVKTIRGIKLALDLIESRKKENEEC